MRVPARVQVCSALYVLGPANRSGILRAGDNKACLRQQSRWRTQQLIDLRLPIGSVSAHVAQVASVPAARRTRMILRWVKRAIEWRRETRSKTAANLLEHRSTRKTQIQVELGNVLCADVVSAAQL